MGNNFLISSNWYWWKYARTNIPTLRSFYISQDSFFKDTKPQISHNQYTFYNWESMESMDFDKMIQFIHDKKIEETTKCNECSKLPMDLNLKTNPQPTFLFVEGFMLYNHKELMDLLDRKFIIVIPKELCYQRRREANDKWDEPELNFEPYFEHVIWPFFIKNHDVCFSLTDLKVLDGRKPTEGILQEVIDHLEGTRLCQSNPVLLKDILES